jgi:galactose mutarotase-like enzyme
MKQNQYPTYILSDKSVNARAEIVPERGGIITNWRVQGQELLYFDAERFADPSLSIRGGIPILFPICGNLPNNLYVHQGHSYTLHQHGFARDLPWTVLDSQTEENAKLTLQLLSTEDTLALYPFEFELQFTYILKGNTLTIEQAFINQSAEVMPFSTGLHPYFLTTNKNALSFDIPATQLRDHQTQKHHPFTGQFDFDSDEIDVAFFPVNQQKASFTNRRNNYKLTVSYSDIYKGVVFWTVKGKDYCCLEPWSAARNAINSKENLVYLQPQESCTATVQFRVSYLNPETKAATA